MNFLSTYSRILPRIVWGRQMLTFHLDNCILTKINSSRLASFTEPLRLYSLTSINRHPDDIEARLKKIIEKDPSKDRRIKIPVETSIRYMKSNAYKECYGNNPVWKPYRRNHKGGFPPYKTRKMCIRADVIQTGSPCPICRDEYLVVDHLNLDLLKQFISPTTGELLSYSVTGVCQKQHERLILAFMKARELGTITYDVPFRKYDYSEYIESL